MIFSEGHPISWNIWVIFYSILDLSHFMDNMIGWSDLDFFLPCWHRWNFWARCIFLLTLTFQEWLLIMNKIKCVNSLNTNPNEGSFVGRLLNSEQLRKVFLLLHTELALSLSIHIIRPNVTYFWFRQLVVVVHSSISKKNSAINNKQV